MSYLTFFFQTKCWKSHCVFTFTGHFWSGQSHCQCLVATILDSTSCRISRSFLKNQGICFHWGNSCILRGLSGNYQQWFLNCTCKLLWHLREMIIHLYLQTQTSRRAEERWKIETDTQTVLTQIGLTPCISSPSLVARQRWILYLCVQVT